MTTDAGAATADYWNWIRRRIVVAIASGAVVLAAVAALLGRWSVALAAVVGTAAPVSGGLAIFLAYLSYRFSDRGGGVQRRLWSLVIDHLEWNGDGLAVDIGTGNGALAIQLAERHPRARVVGVDPWPATWGYSRAACRDNARRRHVADRDGEVDDLLDVVRRAGAERV